MNIGEKIRFYRKKIGYTQKKLGEESHTSETTIKQYELNKRQPRIEQLRRIAAALGVGLDALIDLDLDGGDELTRSTMETRDELLGDTPRTRKEAAEWKEGILLEQFHQLNDEGQTKAVEAVENLTYNPKFSKK